MYISDRGFNVARKESYNAFITTLDECYSKEGITERHFADCWIQNMKKYDGIIKEGWYCPPPNGIAVLAGGTGEYSRVNYDSLRNKRFWPSDYKINWSKDLFYFYCSPVSLYNGTPGDLSLTLYFGTDEKIKNHFRTTFSATMQALQGLSCYKSSKAMYEGIIDDFSRKGLVGCGLSSTDPAMTNLGHTLPAIMINSSKLSNHQINEISKSRQFINAKTDWAFKEGQQFTFEPQLKSAYDLSLPQISYHFLVKYSDGEFRICDDVIELLERFGLC